MGNIFFKCFQQNYPLLQTTNVIMDKNQEIEEYKKCLQKMSFLPFYKENNENYKDDANNASNSIAIDINDENNNDDNDYYNLDNHFLFTMIDDDVDRIPLLNFFVWV